MFMVERLFMVSFLLFLCISGEGKEAAIDRLQLVSVVDVNMSSSGLHWKRQKLPLEVQLYSMSGANQYRCPRHAYES